MLRPYRRPEEPTFQTFNASRNRRIVFIIGLPLLLIAGLVRVSSNLRDFAPNGGVRKLVIQCIHSIYVESTQAAIDMPNPPTVTASQEVPSIYAICQVCICRVLSLAHVRVLLALTLSSTGVDSTRGTRNHSAYLHSRRCFCMS